MKETQKPVRLHKNLAVAVISCLDNIFNQNLQADKVIAKMLKSDKRWGKTRPWLYRRKHLRNHSLEAIVYRTG